MGLNTETYPHVYDILVARCDYADCGAMRTATADGEPYDLDWEMAEDDLSDSGWTSVDGGSEWFCPAHAAIAKFPQEERRKAKSEGAFSAADHRRLLAAVYGQAVGDALGVPYEFQHRDAFRCEGMIGFGTHRQPAGTWSDDTAMMLATLDSLAEHDGKVDEDDLRAKYVAWLYHGEYTPDGVVFDAGGTTRAALAAGRGATGERDNGNGGLMRILPLAFTRASDDDIRKVSAVTHAHAISMDACVRFVRVARLLLAEGRDYSVSEICKTADISDQRLMPRDSINSGMFVLNTLQAAIWCLVNTHSYRECVLTAVNLGVDTDTTAAVAGGLAGIVYGLDGLESQWIAQLRGAELLEHIVAKAALHLPGLYRRNWRITAARAARKVTDEERKGLHELVQLEPEFQKAMDEGRKLYHWNESDTDDRGVMVYRGISYDPIVDRYWHAIYQAWGDRGSYGDVLDELNLSDPDDLQDFYENGDYDLLDLDETLALLLVPTRQERFGDGSLCGYLDEGHILRLLRHVGDMAK